MSDDTLLAVVISAVSLIAGFLLGLVLLPRKAPAPGVSVERRGNTFAVDQEKFSTQRNVTYILLGLFTGVASTVLYQNDQSERSMILQTVINLTLLAVGYWLGASKAAADSAGTVGKIAEQSAPVAAAAAAAAAKPDPNAVTAAPTNPETGNVPAAEVQPERKPE